MSIELQISAYNEKGDMVCLVGTNVPKYFQIGQYYLAQDKKSSKQTLTTADHSKR